MTKSETRRTDHHHAQNASHGFVGPFGPARPDQANAQNLEGSPGDSHTRLSFEVDVDRAVVPMRVHCRDVSAKAQHEGDPHSPETLAPVGLVRGRTQHWHAACLTLCRHLGPCEASL